MNIVTINLHPGNGGFDLVSVEYERSKGVEPTKSEYQQDEVAIKPQVPHRLNLLFLIGL